MISIPFSIRLLLLSVLFLVFLGLSSSFGQQMKNTEASTKGRVLTLAETLKLAQKNSLTLETEEKKLLAAKLNMKNVDLDLLPDLQVGAGYKYQEDSEDSFGDINPFISLSQVVFNNSQSYSQKLEGTSRLFNSQVRLHLKRNELYSKVINGYFSLIQAQNRAGFEEHLVKQSNVDLKKAQLRAQDGLISQIELLQNESMMEMVKIERQAGLNKVELKAMELAALLNIGDDGSIQAEDTFSPVFYSIDFEQCKTFAEQNNPTLQLNNQLLAKVPEFRKLLPRLSWPSVSLSAYAGSGATQWDSDQRYGISITATKTLFDFGKTDRKKEMFSLQLDSMEKSIGDMNNKTISQIRRLHKEFTDAASIVQKLEKLHGPAEKISRAMQKNYDLGVISYETLLKTQKQTFERKNNYLAAVNRYLGAEMLLKLNCGVTDIKLLLKQDPNWINTQTKGGNKEKKGNLTEEPK